MKTVFSAGVALALVAGVAHGQPNDNNDHRDHRGQAAPMRQAPPMRQAAPMRPQGPPPAARTGAFGGWAGARRGQMSHAQSNPLYENKTAPNITPAYRSQWQTQYRPGHNRPGSPYGDQRNYQPGVQNGLHTYQRTYQAGVQDGNQRNYQQGARGALNTGGRPAYANGQRGYANVQRSFRPQDQGRPRYDPDRYRHSYRAERQFDAGEYYEPNGWYYRRWGYGDYFPFGWFTTSYYLNGFDYGLPPPPIGAEWVRNGPDALLVDIWTGEVLSVEYDVFY